jgi:hypothetical protein
MRITLRRGDTDRLRSEPGLHALMPPPYFESLISSESTMITGNFCARKVVIQ